jgi:four helix bundle protein
MGDFRKLIAWQEAKRLAVLSRDACTTLPRTEQFALGSQWRRAAYSVALNIAEGAAQSSPRQFRRYLEIAKGSLDELQGVLELAEALGYVSGQKLSELRLARTHCAHSVTPHSVNASLGNAYSHSIVAGGFELTSYTTRFTPRTSLMMRLLIPASTSGGNAYQSAVIPSRLVTARSATT